MNNEFKGESVSILLVEDNIAHAELVKRILAEHRIANEVIHVFDGEAALDYLFKREQFANDVTVKRPHLVLLDLRLPKIDGLQVLTEIKSSEMLKRLPVVILTSSNAEEDITRAYNFHANSYLVKPDDFKKFTEMLNNLGFYWLIWNQNPPDNNI